MSKPARHRKRASRSEPVDSVSSNASGGRHEAPVRKNHYLYQWKIDMAKEILGTKTESEALDGALDMLIYGEALARGTEQMAGEEYHDVLGITDELPGADSGA
jgi:hypothetical protein